MRFNSIVSPFSFIEKLPVWGVFSLRKSISTFFLAILLLYTPISCTEKSIQQLSIRQNRFKVELAQTQEQRTLGLMYRSELPLNQGMLFIFDREDRFPFWMKNTAVSLDIIWIDSHKKIVFIQHQATPFSEQILDPKKSAFYALEINGGLSKKYHFQVGDQVKFF